MGLLQRLFRPKPVDLLLEIERLRTEKQSTEQYVRAIEERQQLKREIKELNKKI